MIWGAVTGTADDLAIDAQLIELEDGTVVAGERVRGSDVFALVDSLATRLAPHIGADRGSPPIRVRQLGTDDIEALAAFQEGISLERAGRVEEAEVAFEKAVAMDSSFVLPLVRLAGRAEAWPRPDAPGAGSGAEGARRAADHHRARALEMLRRMGDDFEFTFEGLDEEQLLAKLDSTLGQAMSRVTVIVRDLDRDSLGRLMPPPRPDRRPDGDPPR